MSFVNHREQAIMWKDVVHSGRDVRLFYHLADDRISGDPGGGSQSSEEFANITGHREGYDRGEACRSSFSEGLAGSSGENRS